jgi:hypothetical protein
MSNSRLSWLSRVEPVVKIASDVAEIAIHLKADRSPLSIASLGVRALSSYLQHTGPDPSKVFRSGGEWLRIPNAERMAKPLLVACQTLPSYQSVRTGDDYRSIAFVDVHDYTIGWLIGESWVEGPWVRTADAEDAQYALGRLLWETIGPNIMATADITGNLRLVNDPVGDTLPSRKAASIYTTLDKFRQAGRPRSVMLVGEPGSGKSHAMRHISKLAGGFTLRFSARGLEAVSGSIAPTIMVLRPSSVLIDDLDRVNNPQAILSEIEMLREMSGLFLVSVNSVESLDPAVLRPGRIDDVILFDRLEPDIVEAMLVGVPVSTADVLRTLPIAYIDEFKACREVLGDAEALAKVADLHQRSEKIMAMMKGTEPNGVNGVIEDKPCST